MRYLMMSKATDDDTPPDESLHIAMGKFIEELTASGVLLATGGLGPEGIRVTSSGDEITVTDGPFAEAKEAVAGFALVEVRSKEEAIELTRRFRKIVGDGESVIQEVFGP
jgi:hypothetical protein